MYYYEKDSAQSDLGNEQRSSPLFIDEASLRVVGCCRRGHWTGALENFNSTEAISVPPSGVGHKDEPRTIYSTDEGHGCE